MNYKERKQTVGKSQMYSVIKPQFSFKLYGSYWYTLNTICIHTYNTIHFTFLSFVASCVCCNSCIVARGRVQWRPVSSRFLHSEHLTGQCGKAPDNSSLLLLLLLLLLPHFTITPRPPFSSSITLYHFILSILNFI